MSLINQMLKDLDKRQAGVGGGQPLSQDVRISFGEQRNYMPLALGAVVIAVAAGGGWVAWQKLKKPSGAPAPQVVAQTAPAAAAPVSPPAPAQPASPPQPTPAGISPADAMAAVKTLAKPEVVAAATEMAKSLTATAAPNAAPAKAPAEAKPTRQKQPEMSKMPKMAEADASAVVKKPVKQTRADDSEAKEVVPKVAAGSAMKVMNAQQRSANLYRQAVALYQQGKGFEAKQSVAQAVATDSANHPARLMLAGMLMDAGSNAEAIALLRDGMALAPEQSGFAMALARLQVATGAKEDALATLQKGLAGAGDDPQYHAFYAALLQGQGRHADAIQQYLVALRSDPGMPNWLVGIGISLQAENKLTDAAEAFRRALNTGELSPELQKFAGQRLAQIQQQ